MSKNMSSTKKHKWGVQVGQPTKLNSGQYLYNIGKWVIGAYLNGKVDYSEPRLFATRREARAAAKEECRSNRFWNFHARKYNG